MTFRLLDNAALPTMQGEPTITFRQPPVESAALIDILLPEDEQNTVQALYESEDLAEYFTEHDIEMLDFGGGEFGITANMLSDIPIDVLKNVKFRNGRTIGRRRAELIHKVCVDSMVTEPYY